MINEIALIKQRNSQLHYFLLDLGNQIVYRFKFDATGPTLELVNIEQELNEAIEIVQSYSNENEQGLDLHYIQNEILPKIPNYSSMLYNSQDFVNDVITMLQMQFQITLNLVVDKTQFLPVAVWLVIAGFKPKSLLFFGLVVFITGQVNGGQPHLNYDIFRRSMTKMKKFTWKLWNSILSLEN